MNEVTSEQWLSLTDDQKKTYLKSWLSELAKIKKKSHALSNTRGQGKLISLKQELQDKILKVIEIEKTYDQSS